jgi:hypothetical protein
MAMAKEMADTSVITDFNSDSKLEREEKNKEKDEEEQADDVQSSSPAVKMSTDGMYSNLPKCPASCLQL